MSELRRNLSEYSGHFSSRWSQPSQWLKLITNASRRPPGCGGTSAYGHRRLSLPVGTLTHVLRQPPLVADISFGIPAKKLGEMQKLLNQMVATQELQLQLKGRMQVVSEQKKLAYATLKQSVSRFFRIARIALDEEPQQLEILGLVVKA